ncbi:MULTISPECIES: HTH domain-containing protein [Priestia]|uniref:HTH domain-containing protein n=1 Tax=Priestia TaxID=2800373 RepID=UPI00034639BD|nr:MULTISPECIES: HTH domain-containing protein [Priestia]AYE53460.1 HTH domain-containing protein [Priestia megaterium NCT-2]MBK0010678.1 HTH domain-containing protein [Bacillus sp. S35]MBY0029745.1 HTH domain-containing protein [Priestia aryabhattai]MCM3645131.1 helix-turn-helix domain-containing protein [Priestia aryabhattai]
MLVKKMLNGIMMKEITIKELADRYNVSTRTIQSKIKKLGYEWDSKESIYRYVGEESEPVDVDFSTLISKNSKMPAEQKLATSEVAASTSYLDESGSTSTSSSKASTVDAIDLLLQSPKDRSKRVYRGFYFDNDVLSIIDRVPKSYKSELVNEALRKVFKEKGLLD